MERKEFEKEHDYTESIVRKSSVHKDCLSCSKSASEPATHGDILHCCAMPFANDVVDETKICNLWN